MGAGRGLKGEFLYRRQGGGMEGGGCLVVGSHQIVLNGASLMIIMFQKRSDRWSRKREPLKVLHGANHPIVVPFLIQLTREECPRIRGCLVLVIK